MKKRYKILIVAGLLFAILSPTTLGDPEQNLEEAGMNFETEQSGQTSVNPATDSDYNQVNGYGLSVGDGSQKKLVLRGTWGFQGDNSSDGTVAGHLIRRPRFMVFHGFFDTISTQEKTRIVGIIKNGYFNGKIFYGNDTVCPITGLLKINREQRLVKLRWMTPHQTGWAVANISLVDV